MATQALLFAVASDIHQDIMHDGPQRLQAFKDAAIQPCSAANSVSISI